MVHTSPTRSILMEEVSGKQDKVDFGISGDLEDLSKGVDGVLTSDWVFLCVANVIVGR